MASLSTPLIKCIEQDDHHGRFVVEELEQGMGITLGNALRRTLLRYLPGTAVSYVYIDGITHEFAPIPNVKEDVLDFLLNVKALRIKPLTSAPSGKLILEKSGKGPIFASDIITGMDYEIVNPEQYMATIDSDNGKLYVELTVENGTGFRTSEDQYSDRDQVGSIPIDSIFSPVRNVNYNVEPMHTGHVNAREQLTIDIWTDGTVEPQVALSRSAAILAEQFSSFVDFGRPAEEHIEETIAANTAAVASKSAVPDEILNLRIENLDFSVRTNNCLQRGNIHTVAELIKKTPKELMEIRNFGEKSRTEVEEKLQELGISFSCSGKAADKGANDSFLSADSASFSDDTLNMRIEDLGFSVRTNNCLQRGNIHTVGELIQMSEKDLMGLRDFGAKSRTEVADKIHELGLPFPYVG